MAAKRWVLPSADQQRKLAAFIDPMRWQDLRCRDKVVALCEWALAESKNECVRRAYDSKKQYIEWLRGGRADGLARQHRASKHTSQWVPFRMIKSKENQEDHNGEGTDEGCSDVNFNWLQSAWDGAAGKELQTPADVQQVVDGEAAGWASQWAVEETMEDCAWPEDMEEMEPMTVQQLRQAARSFKKETGLGWDRLHPHALLRLPTGLLQWLCRILTNAERLGSWEAAIGLVLVVLIPKGEGGLRPIGLLPTLIRIWSKARRQVARDWEEKEWRGYLYGGKGAGAQVAAWKHAARTEAATLMRRSHAATLVDLEKAFERIQHHRLVEAARQWNFPLRILKMALAAYRLPRVIGIGGVFSKAMVATKGATAGCVFATLELRAMILQIGDAICNRFPEAELTMYVDDDTIEAEGEEHEVEETVVGATELLCTSLTEVGLAVSPKKNCCLASSAALGRRIAARLTPWAVQHVEVAKMLGVGVTAGVRRNMQATAQRIKKLAGRKENYAKLKRLGIDTGRILRTGGVSTMTYGLHVHGVSDYMLLQMRRVAAGLCGSMARGSHHNLELIVADNGRNRKVDPAFDAHQLPIGAWAEACWQGWLHYTTLEGMVQGARRALLKARRP